MNRKYKSKDLPMRLNLNFFNEELGNNDTEQLENNPTTDPVLAQPEKIYTKTEYDNHIASTKNAAKHKATQETQQAFLSEMGFSSIEDYRASLELIKTAKENFENSKTNADKISELTTGISQRDQELSALRKEKELINNQVLLLSIDIKPTKAAMVATHLSSMVNKENSFADLMEKYKNEHPEDFNNKKSEIETPEPQMAGAGMGQQSSDATETDTLKAQYKKAKENNQYVEMRRISRFSHEKKINLHN